MIVDFQHHFTPRELIKGDPGDRLVLNYDALGAPSYTLHSLLYDLDEHIAMMDMAGIDTAWLTSGPECAPSSRPRADQRQGAKGRAGLSRPFLGAAHAHPLGGPDHSKSSTAAAANSVSRA